MHTHACIHLQAALCLDCTALDAAAAAGESFTHVAPSGALIVRTVGLRTGVYVYIYVYVCVYGTLIVRTIDLRTGVYMFMYMYMYVCMYMCMAR